MLMLSFDYSNYFGKKQKHDLQCVCGSHHFRFNRKLKHLKFGFLPICYVTSIKTLTCCKCQRNYAANNSPTELFPKYSRAFVLSHFSGLPIVLITVFMLSFFYNSINPNDDAFRADPRIGDIYFIDYYQAFHDKRDINHPYRIAQLVYYSEATKTMELKVSRWSNSRKLGVLNDYAVQKYSYKSSFFKNTV